MVKASLAWGLTTVARVAKQLPEEVGDLKKANREVRQAPQIKAGTVGKSRWLNSRMLVWSSPLLAHTRELAPSTFALV